MKTTRLLWVLRWLLLLVVTTIFGCGGGGDKAVTATVAGTLTLPDDATSMEYVVQIDTNLDGDDDYVTSISGTCGSGTIVNYSISNVPAGTYYIYAVVRNVSVPESELETGDYVGVYGVTATSTSFPPPNASVPSSGTVDFDILMGTYDALTDDILFGAVVPSFSFTFAYLQYRTYENPVSNRYQGFIELTKDGAPIQSADILEIGMFDAAGTPVAATSEGFGTGNYMFFNCSVSPCAQAGPLADNGFWANYPTLAADIYSIELDTADGQLLALDVDYPGQLELPMVTSATMHSRWVGSDLVLSWVNPTGATNWSEVDQLRIVVFDGANNDILYVRADSNTDTVTIPASLVSQAAGLGDGTLANWEVQTRAFDANSMNIARGYSNRVNVAAP